MFDFEFSIYKFVFKIKGSKNNKQIRNRNSKNRNQMTRLSVNINKIATLRNSRGGNNPDLIQVAKDCERFGAQGITVHPRPDERHIRYNDVFELKKMVTTEFNIEGNCQEQKFIDLVLANQPE